MSWSGPWAAASDATQVRRSSLFLGVLMWQLFKGTLIKSNANVDNQINQIK
ncbi:MAG: hypothetical protein M3Q48_16960 [Actinomycetota bacterium]|nr:hypothetical protein [Actinomycetota bacterium]